MKKYILLTALLSGMALFLQTCAGTKSMQAHHPEEVKMPVICSDCHGEEQAPMDHDTGFIVRHKYYASQQEQVCNACHKYTFCADCHTHKDELKPGDKYKDMPERAIPHRGDYLTQHRIDGKINPASCFKCHGRQNNSRCKLCHA